MTSFLWQGNHGNTFIYVNMCNFYRESDQSCYGFERGEIPLNSSKPQSPAREIGKGGAGLRSEDQKDYFHVYSSDRLIRTKDMR